MNNDLMFSSKSDEWATPQKFFDELNNEFRFNLDPCATDGNHKCSNYYTIADNGLAKNWGGVPSVRQSAVFGNRIVGCKVILRRTQRQHPCCVTHSSADGHKVFSRFLPLPFRDSIHQRAVEVRKCGKFRTVPVNVSDFSRCKDARTKQF